jgi:hypothetical protein
MEIEFIYTYLEREQEIVRRSISSKNLISKSCIADIAIHDLTSRERIDLKKISCCIYFSKAAKANTTIPQWYYEAKGKLWFKNGKLEDR